MIDAAPLGFGYPYKQGARLAMFFMDTDLLQKEAAAMKSKTVILWGREDLLGKAVELFLTDCEAWEVVRGFDEQNLDKLVHLVETHHPKVIIINLGDCEDCIHLPLYLMHNHPELKVITVNLENNMLEVYDRHRVWVKEISDLLAVVDD